MFERKNQNILSEHYSKLISDDSGSDSDDDFITLKRVDHDLDDMASGLTKDDRPSTDPTGHSTTFEEDLAANLSKRKQKLGKAKRAIATGGVNTKLVFDDEGKPHQLYELEDGEKWFEERGGLLGAQEEGRKFAEGERSRMKVADVMDREEAKEKKREKKRKRKDRERAVSISSLSRILPTGANNNFFQPHGTDDGGTIVGTAPPEEDDGYVSPDFDLPSESEVEDKSPPVQAKKDSLGERPPSKKRKVDIDEDIDEDEELALRLLRQRR